MADDCKSMQISEVVLLFKNQGRKVMGSGWLEGKACEYRVRLGGEEYSHFYRVGMTKGKKESKAEGDERPQ